MIHLVAHLYFSDVYHYNGNAYSAYFDVYDIYDRVISHRNRIGNIKQWYHRRLESKYRYSGLLYDKLRCLFSFVYHNRPVYLDIYPDSSGKLIYYCIERFYTQIMNIGYIDVLVNVYSYSNIKKLYFIWS